MQQAATRKVSSLLANFIKNAPLGLGATIGGFFSTDAARSVYRLGRPSLSKPASLIAASQLSIHRNEKEATLFR